MKDTYLCSDLKGKKYIDTRRILFVVQGARRRTERSIPEYVSIGSTEQQRGNVGKRQAYGGLAQLGEHLLCTQGVKSSNLLISTIAYESKYEAVKSTKFKILGFVA